MALLFTLLEVTPYRLRYLANATGSDNNPQSGLIVNRNLPPGPNVGDLRFDSRIWRNFPIHYLVSTLVVNQTDARRIMQGDGLISTSDIEGIRAHIYVTSLTSNFTAIWSCDVNEGAAAGDPQSAGFSVIIVNAPGGQGGAQQFAWVDIDFQHTFDR